MQIVINEEKLKKIESLIDKRLETDNEKWRCWSTGAYWVLCELGIVENEDWVEDAELCKS